MDKQDLRDAWALLWPFVPPAIGAEPANDAPALSCSKIVFASAMTWASVFGVAARKISPT